MWGPPMNALQELHAHNNWAEVKLIPDFHGEPGLTVLLLVKFARIRSSASRRRVLPWDRAGDLLQTIEEMAAELLASGEVDATVGCDESPVCQSPSPPKEKTLFKS